MSYTFEEGVKPTKDGTHVPYHPGLKLFSNTKRCQTCGQGAKFEYNGVRICGFDYVRRKK